MPPLTQRGRGRPRRCCAAAAAAALALVLLLAAGANAAAPAPAPAPSLAEQHPVIPIPLPAPAPAAPPVAVEATAPPARGQRGQRGGAATATPGPHYADTAAQLFALLTSSADVGIVRLGRPDGSPATLSINTTSWPSPVVIEAGRAVTLTSASPAEPSTLDWGRVAPAFTVSTGGALAVAGLVLAGLPDASAVAGAARYRRPLVVGLPLSPGIAAYQGSALAVINSTAYVSAADCASFQASAGGGGGPGGQGAAPPPAAGVGEVGAGPVLTSQLAGLGDTAAPNATSPAPAPTLATHLLTRAGNTTRTLPTRGLRTGADLGPVTVSEVNVLYVCSSPGVPAGGATPVTEVGGEGAGTGEPSWAAPPVGGGGGSGGQAAPAPAPPAAATATQQEQQPTTHPLAPPAVPTGWLIAVAVLAGAASAGLVAAGVAATALVTRRRRTGGDSIDGSVRAGRAWRGWKWGRRRPGPPPPPPSPPPDAVPAPARLSSAFVEADRRGVGVPPAAHPSGVRPSPFAAVAATVPSPTTVASPVGGPPPPPPPPLEMALAGGQEQRTSDSLGVLPTPPGLRRVRTASTPGPPSAAAAARASATDRVHALLLARSGALDARSSVPADLLERALTAGALGEVAASPPALADAGSSALAGVGSAGAVAGGAGEASGAPPAGPPHRTPTVRPREEETGSSPTPPVVEEAVAVAPPPQAATAKPTGRPPLPPVRTHVGSGPPMVEAIPSLADGMGGRAGGGGGSAAVRGPSPAPRGDGTIPSRAGSVVAQATLSTLTFGSGGGGGSLPFAVPTLTAATGPALASGRAVATRVAAGAGAAGVGATAAAQTDIAHLEIGPLVGRGSFGAVYKVKWYGAIAALKVMALAPPAAAAAAPSLLSEAPPGPAPPPPHPLPARLMPGSRAVKELVLGMSVSHPNLVQAYRAWIVQVKEADAVAEEQPALPPMAGEAGGGAPPAAPRTKPSPDVAVEVETADAADAVARALGVWAGNSGVVDGAAAGAAAAAAGAAAAASSAAAEPHVPATGSDVSAAPENIRREAWVLMDFCSGGSLDAAIRSGRFHGGPWGSSSGSSNGDKSKNGSSRNAAVARPLPPAQPRPATDMPAVFRCLRDVAAGMEYLHACGIQHGDLKPCNVLLKINATDPRGYACKLVDFGLARVLGAASAQASTGSPGTVAYAAPEVLSRGVASLAADVFSYGVLAWEVYAGVKPWAGLGVGRIVHEVTIAGRRPPFLPGTPRWLHTLIDRCWAADPRARPTFGAVLAELRKHL